MAEHRIQFREVDFKVFSNSELEERFWNLFASGNWESEYLSFMIDNRKGRIFLDIGSWIGPVTILMSRYYDKVVSVDFDPVAIKSFKNNLEINSISNVVLHEVGFADRAGFLKVNAETLGSSMTSIFTQPHKNSLDLRVTRFDDFMAQLSESNSIGFIKIDCEGAEYKFLDQVYNFMNKQSVKVLISYHPFVLKKPSYYFVKIYHWLRQIPYKRYYFNPNGGILIKKPYRLIFKSTDNFPMADVLES